MLQLRRRKISEQDLKRWELGEGKPLWFAHASLGRELLDLFMPRVTKLQINKVGDDYIQPPSRDWRATLGACQDYVSHIGWGEFIEYDTDIEDFLYYQQEGGEERLNSKYKTRFASWKEKDLSKLRSLLSELVDDYEKGARLNSSQFSLFRKAVTTAGNLKVGSLKRSFTLKGLEVTEVE